MTLQATTLQTRVDSFDIVNLFLRYELRDFGPPLGISINVNNAFDAATPRFMGTHGFTPEAFPNGATLGRLLQLGVSRNF